MRKVDNGGKKRRNKKKRREWRLYWPLTLLPVDRQNTDRLECRTLVPIKWHHFGAYELILLLSVNNDHRRPSGGPIRKSWSLEEGIHCSRHHWALIKGREIRWRTLWARRSSCWLSCKSVHSEIYENIWTNMNPKYKYWMLFSESSVAFEQLVKVRSKFSVVT